MIVPMPLPLPLSKIGRRYGAHVSPPDHRDFGVARMIPPQSRPSYVDLEQYCGPVKDQGQLGACTAFAGTGNREYLARRFQGMAPVLSPLFLYYQERSIDGTLDQDAGSTGRTDCKAMNQFGICTETSDSYDISQFKTPPTSAELREALQWRAGAYHALSNVDDMKSCLASDYPVLIGFAVYQSFETNIGRDGVMPMPGANETQVGGHEVLVIGYDDARGMFKVRNSWGADWGAGGNFFMSYPIAQQFVWDRYIQHLGKPW
jgi:C1A family cysteine protease